MTAPARVVHIVEDLRIGGLERIVQTLVTTLDRSRFAPEVWCLAGGGEIADAIAGAGVGVEIFHMAPRPSPVFLAALARRLRRASARVVHCHGYTACTVGRTAAALARTPRVFAHIHTLGLWLTPRQRRIERVLAAFSTKIVCVSEAVREFVAKHEGIPRRKTEVIRNGISPPCLPDGPTARARLGIRDGIPVLGCVASLAPHKGHAILIESVRLARERVPDMVLLLVGDGPLRSELEHRARQAGIQAVFAGRLADVGPALAAVDAVALLSLEREGIPLALLEALSASKPVVASRVGGIPEVVEDGASGLLCEPGDAIAAARCITALLADPARRHAMGDAGRRTFAARFTARAMTDQVERLYEQ